MGPGGACCGSGREREGVRAARRRERLQHVGWCWRESKGSWCARAKGREGVSEGLEEGGCVRGMRGVRKGRDAERDVTETAVELTRVTYIASQSESITGRRRVHASGRRERSCSSGVLSPSLHRPSFPLPSPSSALFATFLPPRCTQCTRTPLSNRSSDAYVQAPDPILGVPLFLFPLVYPCPSLLLLPNPRPSNAILSPNQLPPVLILDIDPRSRLLSSKRSIASPQSRHMTHAQATKEVRDIC